METQCLFSSVITTSPLMSTATPLGDLTPPMLVTKLPMLSTGSFATTGNGLSLVCVSSTLILSLCFPLMVGW